jgi:hypothetical protein
MQMIPVSSSNLSAIGYDDHTSTLRIEFNNGTAYEYYDVPSKIFDGLMSAGSKGQYFDQFVKKAGFRYSKA